MEAQLTKESQKKFFIGLLAIFLVTAIPLMIPLRAAAGVFELSGGLSINKTTYGEGSFSWTRRYVASVAYYLTERSSIEVAFQDSISRNNIPGIEETTFHDRVYSANWVQHITGKDFPVQPYFKLGIGQLNRDATGYYAGGGKPPQRFDSLTTIAGLGLKVYLTKSLALRGEATTYLTGARIKTWKDNAGATAGLSFFF